VIGYLAPLAPTASDKALSRSYQCGLCHHLGREYGLRYRLLATTDPVFLNVFLDLVGDHPAPVEHRACPLGSAARLACPLAPAPGVRPTRVSTDNARLAAAFGVYMAVEKLRDDVRDGGGPLRRLLLRLYRPGATRARRELSRQGFPVDQVDALLAQQWALERGPPLTLDAAARPSEAISSLLFGHAAADPDQAWRLRAIGACVGGFLFEVDNLLDFHTDLRAGGYNALARALSVEQDPGTMPPEVLRVGCERARRRVDDLERLLAELPVAGKATFLRRTLVDGFRDKLRRLEALPPTARVRATLRAILPPTRPLGRRVLDSASQAVSRVGTLLWYRARLTGALLFAYLAPRTALAERWWPEDPGDGGLGDPALADTGQLGADLAADTGLTGDTGLPDGELDPASPCADIFFGGCGWADCNTITTDCGDQCFGGCCEKPCESACDQACSNACDDACSDTECCQS